jgi:hypothetical protein
MKTMSEPFVVNETNLSVAWGKVLLRVLDNPGTSVSPLVISLSGFTDGEIDEDAEVRRALDELLTGQGDQNTHTVANTIFPASVWRLAKYDRELFFKLYLEDGYPSYKELCPSKNDRGLYFQRLIAFGRGPHDGNQLEHIIKEFKSRRGVRASMFQAAIFDPGEDHVRLAYLKFPCLQHVSFVPEGNRLVMNAFYATQKLLNKAYGNYLGLCRLGHFMAKEMGLEFTRINIFVGVENFDMEGVGKKSPLLEPLKAAVRAAVQRTEEVQLACV